jgi:hypothetical protein
MAHQAGACPLFNEYDPLDGMLVHCKFPVTDVFMPLDGEKQVGLGVMLEDTWKQYGYKHPSKHPYCKQVISIGIRSTPAIGPCSNTNEPLLYPLP